LLWEPRAVPGGLGCMYRGPALSHGSPDPLTMSWSASPLLATWRPWSRPRGGAGCCRGSRVAARAWGELRLGPTYGTPTTRLGDSGVGSLSLYGSRGTLVSGYRQWLPGPPQGRIRACGWGQSLTGDWRAASAFADVVAANPPSVTPPAMSAPAADGRVAPTPGGFVGLRARRLVAAAQAEKYSSAAAPR
jgi:hypothetical protein